MVQRFFFYRIHTEAAGKTVTRHHDFTVARFAHKAQSLLAFVQFAVARAEIALQAIVRQGLPVTRWYRMAFCLQAGHR